MNIGEHAQEQGDEGQIDDQQRQLAGEEAAQDLELVQPLGEHAVVVASNCL